ncbi:MAG: tRNA (adenosine(37)-N6)-threonylcarbamoyltransferase complex transferase subunit TsaD [Bacteroidia bacterium]
MHTNDQPVQNITLLAIESSCDDTAAAVICNGKILSNMVAGQDVHRQYGGVVPELASRSHQKNIVPVVDTALKKAKVSINDIDGIAITQGPGLLGSLLVGSSFAKGLALSLNKPLIAVNHLDAHVLAHLIENPDMPFPFLCLLVSGGHTQIIKVNSPSNMEVLGKTIDDAAGEAFDKAAKILGLPYPGGPLIDKHAAKGNPTAFSFSTSKVPGLDFSFSGFKTAILYFIRDKMAEDATFIDSNLSDICASAQHTIVTYLLSKLKTASLQTNIKNIAIAGGVAANSGLRNDLQIMAVEQKWSTFIPAFEYCTDNAAMIAIAGYHKYLAGEFANLDLGNYASIKKIK